MAVRSITHRRTGLTLTSRCDSYVWLPGPPAPVSSNTCSITPRHPHCVKRKIEQVFAHRALARYCVNECSFRERAVRAIPG